jgi:uncharacterized protein
VWEDAESTGLEPATPAVTGQCSNQLSYDSIRLWANENHEPEEMRVQVFYRCQRCGNCCRWPGGVRLTDGDIGRLAVRAGMAEADWIERFTELHPDRRGLMLKTRAHGECVFLEGLNRCLVQEDKPAQCAGFPNAWQSPGWRAWCEAVPERRGEHEPVV